MSEAICSDCKKPWPSGQTVCSCGGTARTFQQTVNIESSSSVTVSWIATRTIWEKNWPLIGAYILLQLVLAAISYWPSGAMSVAFSLFGSLLSTVLGLFIVAKIVTKTRG